MRRIILGPLAVLLALPALAQQVRDDDRLPGYYEFFHKAGGQKRIAPEAKRDRRIEAGELAPVAMDEPLPELDLPGEDGEPLALSSYRGKTLVLVSYRSWW